MLQSTLLQFFIFVEEILIAINLDLDGELSWLGVFTPLFVLSVFAMVACIFSCCQKRCNVEVGVVGSTHYAMSALCVHVCSWRCSGLSISYS